MDRIDQMINIITLVKDRLFGFKVDQSRKLYIRVFGIDFNITKRVFDYLLGLFDDHDPENTKIVLEVNELLELEITRIDQKADFT